jgi:phosphohistidine phosphatase
MAVPLREALERPLDLVLCSPARRALDTLERARDGLEDAPLRVEPELYLASGDALLARLQQLPDAVRSVLLVGHDPGLHELALTLLRATPGPAGARLRKKLPTGALVVLDLALDSWRDLGPRRARLVSFTRPRDLD